MTNYFANTYASFKGRSSEDLACLTLRQDITISNYVAIHLPA